MDDPHELLDLVDKHDVVIGRIARKEIYELESDGRGFARGVGGFLINNKGQLFVPRRNPHKKIAPNGLDFSAGEHVNTNEEYVDAMIRGFEEELSLKIMPQKLQAIGTVAPFPGLPYFHEIYLYPYSGEAPQLGTDFVSYEWLVPQELLTRLENGEPAKEILLPATRLALDYLNQIN